MSFSRYVLVALAAFLALSAINQVWWRTVRLACWSGGYAENAWMAYCNSNRYGVYDMDAIWYGTEQEVPAAVQQAQVLSLSDSRLQNALSVGGASDWFARRHIKAYFLGLPTEESGFGEQLWDKFSPHPKVVIFDASPYFTGRPGPDAYSLISDARNRKPQAEDLKEFQNFHQRWCQKLAWLCGENFAYFRSREDGHWIFPDPDANPFIGKDSVPNDRRLLPTLVRPNETLSLYPEYLKAAQVLVAKTGLPPHCIVITHVPSEESLESLAPYLAKGLGVTLINPEIPELHTFDRAHLTVQSSKHWTEAFLRQLEPVLQSCISGA